MNSSNHILNSLADFSSDDHLPPVEQWNPEFCGDIDIIIKANGEWLHNGKPINRKRLSVLFSRVLIKQKDQYFLITPVEKLAIQVEWQPFVIVDFEIYQDSGQDCYLMLDNCNNQIRLNSPKQLSVSQFQGLSLPIIQVRRNLYASFSRSCYYRLIEQATVIKHQQYETLQISSAGVDFSLGSVKV